MHPAMRSLWFWGALLSAILASGVSAQTETGTETGTETEAESERNTRGKTYDYIIVGGGVSGLVVANRLTEDPRNTVLVIERGSFDDKPEAIVPWYANLLDTSVMIRPTSAPNPKLNNSTSLVAVAAVVGGGSVVNGMAYIRGSRADYDAWEELGNPGWGWEGMLPYFRKSTTLTPPWVDVAAEWNITWDPAVYDVGPLWTTIPNFHYPDLARFWAAWRTQGIPLPRDINAGSGPGVYWSPSTIDARDMTRATSRKEYYDPIYRARPNLRLVTGHTATEILFRGLRATGVKMVSRTDSNGTAAEEAYARKEVILATGAIQTPQLLQASGIGPRAVLEAAGVTVRRDAPSVGANLQDHATAILQFDLSTPSFPNPTTIFTSATYNATVWAEYMANRTGPIAAGSASSIALLSLPQIVGAERGDAITARMGAQADPLAYLPGVYASYPALLEGFTRQRGILAARLNGNDTSAASFPFPGGGLQPAPLLKPLSRGTVTLDPADPGSGLPVVQYNTFQNPADAEVALAIVRRARGFWASPELAALGPPVETSPGPQAQTDEELLAALSGGVLRPSLAHPAGTCAMMPEALGGCVGPDLRVYGTEGLSVVDASVMPLIPGAPLQATVYAVAEKAADLIKRRG